MHPSQLQQMNSPLRQPQQTVQQHTPQQMQQNLRNPHVRDNTKPFQQQMQMRNVPNQYQFPNQQFSNSQFENNQQARYPPQQSYPPKSAQVPRPHSADFLEFERNHPLESETNPQQELFNNENGEFIPQINSTTPNRYAKHRSQGGYMGSNPQPPRPKSSFEHRAPKLSQDETGFYDDNQANDVAVELSNYDWSEEGYADKMRMTSRSRSQSRASQAHNIVGGMDGGNQFNNQVPRHNSTSNEYNQSSGQLPQYNNTSGPYPNINPQNMYQDHHYNQQSGRNNMSHNLNGHNQDFNHEPSHRDSHADANEEIQEYFPTPLPRKPHTPSSYMNIPQQHRNSRSSLGNKSQQQSQYPNNIRMGSMTPNRFTAAEILAAKRQNEMLDNRMNGNDVSEFNQDVDTGEFKRSASARLHRNKRNYPDIFGDQSVFNESGAQMQNGNIPEDSRRKEQREESMKRLLEWKQRMLQSPLTRKSSRNTSRAQTPTNSSSPAPSMSNTGGAYGDHIRQKVLVELERHPGHGSKNNHSNNSVHSNKSPNNANGNNHTNVTRKVSRKGSGASRSSRSRSSPRVSNRPTTSSSDEGKQIEHLFFHLFHQSIILFSCTSNIIYLCIFYMVIS